MKIDEILDILPHRYPLLLVDRILEIVSGKTCVGLKNVTANEQFFMGHYPGRPIMPGVLIVEAMAQVGAILILSDPANKGMLPIIGAIENVKLRKPVIPGDQLISTTELLWFRNCVGKMRGHATVDGEIVASMEATFKLIPKE